VQLLCRILGGRAFGLGFSRPTVKMSLVNKSVKENRENTADGSGRCVTGVLGDCAFSVDSVTGRCRAEFQGVHVENLCPQTRSSSVSGWKLDKYAFHFETMVHVCGCDIRLQVTKQVFCVLDLSDL
jgi:hypothetical protein